MNDVPSVPGFYWATYRGIRQIVKVDNNNHHKVMFAYRFFVEDYWPLTDFTDWSGPIREHDAELPTATLDRQRVVEALREINGKHHAMPCGIAVNSIASRLGITREELEKP